MNNHNSVVRMEKRAVNKIGLVLIILLAIAALGGGIYFLVKNHDNLDFSFPWSKSNKKAEEEKKAQKEKEKIELERQKVGVVEDDTSNIDSTEITPLGITYDEKEGYKVVLKLINDRPFTQVVEFYNIAIDDYQVDYEGTVEVESEALKYYTIIIKKEDLDLYNIESFRKIYVYMRAYKKGDTVEKEDLKRFAITNSEYGENTQPPKIITNIGNADELKLDYYKREDTVDDYKIYFLATNSTRSNKGYYSVVINSYKVNNTILTNNEFEERIYDGNKKVFVLSIPKSKFKSLDSLTISFFVLRGEDIYTTKATTIDFTK